MYLARKCTSESALIQTKKASLIDAWIERENRVLSFIVPVFHVGPDMDSRGRERGGGGCRLLERRTTWVDENYTGVRASSSHYY